MPELRDEWEASLADLEQRRAAGRAMGGEERLARHHGQGKLDARARIDALVDPGSFMELGTLTGGDEAPAEAIVLGSGKVSGRPVIVAAEDFTVMAGTISHTANSKRYRAAELALRDRVPLVMMLDGAGFRADGKAYGKSPTDLLSQSRCSGYVPLITAGIAGRNPFAPWASRSVGRADDLAAVVHDVLREAEGIVCVGLRRAVAVVLGHHAPGGVDLVGGPERRAVP